MKTSIRIALCLLVLAGLVAGNGAQEKASSEITILVPYKELHEETVVRVNGEKIKGEGGTRTYKASVEKGKDAKFKIEVVIVPNNYEVLKRYKVITLKGGDNVKVDMTVKLKTDRVKARWVATPDDIVDEMAKLAKIGKNDIVYDLGCGDSVMLIRPIQKFGAKKGVGIDIDPKMIRKSREKIKAAKLENRIELRQGDILDVKDMSEATVVMLYIGDLLGERLSPVLRKTLRPGARIVSHRFKLGDWEPTRKITVKGADGDDYELLLWVVPPKVEKKKAG